MRYFLFALSTFLFVSNSYGAKLECLGHLDPTAFTLVEDLEPAQQTLQIAFAEVAARVANEVQWAAIMSGPPHYWPGAGSRSFIDDGHSDRPFAEFLLVLMPGSANSHYHFPIDQMDPDVLQAPAQIESFNPAILPGKTYSLLTQFLFQFTYEVLQGDRLDQALPYTTFMSRSASLLSVPIIRALIHEGRATESTAEVWQRIGLESLLIKIHDRLANAVEQRLYREIVLAQAFKDFPTVPLEGQSTDGAIIPLTAPPLGAGSAVIEQHGSGTGIGDKQAVADGPILPGVSPPRAAQDPDTNSGDRDRIVPFTEGDVRRDGLEPYPVREGDEDGVGAHYDPDARRDDDPY